MSFQHLLGLLFLLLTPKIYSLALSDSQDQVTNQNVQRARTVDPIQKLTTAILDGDVDTVTSIMETTTISPTQKYEGSSLFFYVDLIEDETSMRATLEVLFDHGINPKVKNAQGNSPLTQAELFYFQRPTGIRSAYIDALKQYIAKWDQQQCCH